mmetsp:Transcript_17353/g.20075  ORF Transcript_17353/g.20075 Transcript_17353/m.20075 type:complete len:455 (+) Transcript_17353:155-1519(+)
MMIVTTVDNDVQSSIDQNRPTIIMTNENVDDDDCVTQKNTTVDNVQSSIDQDRNRHQASEESIQPLHATMNLLKEPFFPGDYLSICQDIVKRKRVIDQHMGSMPQCRGKLGDRLREAGAVDRLLEMLYILISEFFIDDFTSNMKLKQTQNLKNEDCITFDDTVFDSVIELSIGSLGALRDLACGNAINRATIGSFKINQYRNKVEIESGLHIVSFFIKRNHHVLWNDILCSKTSEDQDTTRQPTARGKLELKLLTAATGVVRNITHSTQTNCEELHKCGLTEYFIWRLRHGHEQQEHEYVTTPSLENSYINNVNETSELSRLPDPTKPWREACYRISGSLINMAEKYHQCALRCTMDDELIYILLESWGGLRIYADKGARNRYPLLHLGLNAIFTERLYNFYKNENEQLRQLIQGILDKEIARKKSAQEKEEKRKATKLVKIESDGSYERSDKL